MKKLLLGLGSLASIAAPVATVVACNKDADPKADADKFDFTADLAKVKKLTSTKTIAQIKTALDSKAKGAELKAAALGITIPDLTDDVTATFSFEKAEDTLTASAEVKVTLKKGEETKSQMMTIEASDKVDFTEALAKYVDVDSDDDKNTLKAALKTIMKAVGAVVTNANLGTTAISTSGGMTVEEITVVEVYDEVTGKIKVKVTLSKGTQEASKEFTVTASDAS